MRGLFRFEPTLLRLIGAKRRGARMTHARIGSAASPWHRPFRMTAANGEAPSGFQRTGNSCIREDMSDSVARCVSDRAEAVIISGLHEVEIRNALRHKRFRGEINDAQLATSIAMMESDLAAERLVVREIDWPSVWTGAERLLAAATGSVVVRTIDLIHVSVALISVSSGLVSLDQRQRRAARVSGREVVGLKG